ncbi:MULTISPECIES: nicotinate-nucleotide adenylyltransferase [unclassified Prochlorococcus]|uniref:nicotinate-nucleotide adenylyltransferase n=1 Tax=unclassified Prochlorococcus TaxID=2627481 RepID=UPI00053393E7|nr:MULTISPECIES: nicotinate-nucleotide adenylyltransferase [unclassified Prochlorococcus]KGG14795.1 Nicotinate-nucleotide adenylyltransferase bacterial NadD family [Prochlorococcus sp. MIT 0602]KGG15771.1 Nicotinate-nucleotide adenylyltransferase bacterial NadD family [Prochlorococcus sp. MIT 0603]
MNQHSYSSIALLGTSADPPTTGHKALLMGLSNLFPKVITWASDNPAKEHKASLKQRHELLNILVKAIALPNIELKQELSSQWAIKTIDKAIECWPGKKLILIIGSDLINDLPNWFEAKNVLSKAQLGIVPRQGWPMSNTDLKPIYDLGGVIKILPLNIPDTASSDIHTQQLLSQIPKAILPILKQKNLYGISKRIQ